MMSSTFSAASSILVSDPARRQSVTFRRAPTPLPAYLGDCNRNKPALKSHILRVQAAAKDESDGSNQGRLVRDALEFNAAKASLDQPAATAAAPLQQEERKAGDLLGSKYKVVKLLARGKSGLVYKAERPGGGYVAVKSLSLRSMSDWKQLELFEKEASTMRKLKHSGIPAYLDYFEVDSQGDRGYFLVQELVEGKSLEQMVEAGWRPSQEEAQRITSQLLDTLAYLHKQQVVHRDIKPENIILQGGKPGGKVFLTDFGGAQVGPSEGPQDNEVAMDIGTVVGTYGYMAPEQFRGTARTASDLFALGGTLLYMLSGEPPSSFPQRRLKLDFSSVETSRKLQRLLEGLLQPAWEDRLTIQQAKALLAGQGSAQSAPQGRSRPAFGEWGWGYPQDRKAESSSKREADGEAEEQPASTSGRNAEPRGFGLNPVLLALAAAYVLPGPLAPLVALSLPFWLGSKKQSRRRRNACANDATSSSRQGGINQKDEDEWMAGSQSRQEGGFGFSDGPAQELGKEADQGRQGQRSEEEQREAARRRRQQQMAAFQQQQILSGLMRMAGAGMIGRGYRRPFGMRGGGFVGPFMF